MEYDTVLTQLLVYLHRWGVDEAASLHAEPCASQRKRDANSRTRDRPEAGAFWSRQRSSGAELP
ncbi:hypothetical protein [Saccharopolyspora sp. NPDC002376]